MLIARDCHNKWPETWWLETTKIYFLIVLKNRIHNQGVGKAALPPKALERALPLFCPASGGSRHPLACGCIILVSASVFTRPYRRLYQCLCVCVCVCVCVCMCSVVSDSVIPLTVVHQAPLSMGFSRQEYWSGLPFPPSGDLLNPGIELTSPSSPIFQMDSLPLSHLVPFPSLSFSFFLVKGHLAIISNSGWCHSRSLTWLRL